MGHNGNSYYIGIDLNDSYAMVSFFQQNMKEPETVSTVAGSEEFQIPLVLARRKSIGKWYYGDEARRLSKSGEMVCIDQLLKRALNSEKIVIDDDSFMAEELLALFLKKVMELPSKLGNPSSFDRLVICVDRLTKENVPPTATASLPAVWSSEQPASEVAVATAVATARIVLANLFIIRSARAPNNRYRVFHRHNSAVT